MGTLELANSLNLGRTGPTGPTMPSRPLSYDLQCMICFDSYTPNEVESSPEDFLFLTCCGTILHTSCVDAWHERLEQDGRGKQCARCQAQWDVPPDAVDFPIIPPIPDLTLNVAICVDVPGAPLTHLQVHSGETWGELWAMVVHALTLMHRRNLENPSFTINRPDMIACRLMRPFHNNESIGNILGEFCDIFPFLAEEDFQELRENLVLLVQATVDFSFPVYLPNEVQNADALLRDIHIRVVPSFNPQVSYSESGGFYDVAVHRRERIDDFTRRLCLWQPNVFAVLFQDEDRVFVARPELRVLQVLYDTHVEIVLRTFPQADQFYGLNTPLLRFKMMEIPAQGFALGTRAIKILGYCTYKMAYDIYFGPRGYSLTSVWIKRDGIPDSSMEEAIQRDPFALVGSSPISQIFFRGDRFGN
jgi:hypothetical protein